MNSEKFAEKMAESLGGPDGWRWMCQDCDTTAIFKVGEFCFCRYHAKLESDKTGLKVRGLNFND